MPKKFRKTSSSKTRYQGTSSVQGYQLSALPVGTGNLQETPTGNAGPGELPYGQLHQIILQKIMNTKGLLGFNDVKETFRQAREYCKIPHPETEKENKLFIQAVCKSINSKIMPLNLGISLVRNEFAPTGFYMFGILTETRITKLQMYFSKMEIELFHRIIHLIFTTGDDFFLPQTLCMNESRNLRSGKLSLSDAEQLIKEMGERAYLFIETDSECVNVTVGIRGLKELENYLVENYPGSLVECKLCNNYLLHGFRCGQCPTYVHSYCYDKYKKSSKGHVSCVSCKSTCWAARNREGMIIRKRVDPEKPTHAEIE